MIYEVTLENCIKATPRESKGSQSYRSKGYFYDGGVVSGFGLFLHSHYHSYLLFEHILYIFSLLI